MQQRIRSKLDTSRLAAAVALLLAVLLIAACGSSDDESPATEDVAATTTETTNGGEDAGESGDGANGEDNPYGATFTNGEYGENYNPSIETIDNALYSIDALPSDPDARNVVLAGLARAEADVDNDLAMECWRDSICDTGTGGELTVGISDGFGGNIARQIFKMEVILQALAYPEVGRIIYTAANLDTQKAISDMRSLIAQEADLIVSYPDAGEALIPVYREATERGIPVALWSNANIGQPGEDYLTFTGTDNCALGEANAEILNETFPDGAKLAFLGGTPGNPSDPIWQGCQEDALNANIEVAARADTDWTREGALEAMSGVLSSHPDVNAVSYDYGDAFVGALRAFEAADIPLDITAMVKSDDNPLLCAWQRINNPNFDLWTFSALFSEGRIGLTAGMMAREGAAVPPEILFQPSLRQVDADSCRTDIPPDGSPSSLVPAELQSEMFG